MELSSLNPQNFSLKKFLIFFPKKPALKKFLIFSQECPEFSGNGNPPPKNPYISGNGNPKIAFYITGNGTFWPQPQRFFPEKTSYIFF